MTRRYAVVGDPVAHSLSPLIHNAWMRQAGIDACYERIHLSSQDPVGDIRALAADYAGLNVTLPHKTAALAAAGRACAAALRIGAANTLAREEGHGFAAFNTDVEGFEIALSAVLGKRSGPIRVVMIGAGGAARAAIYALGLRGDHISICNRTPANALRLARDLAPEARTGGLEMLAVFADEADIVVNSASVGHAGGELPGLPAGRGRPFLDLSYGRAAEAALSAAAASGWTPHDGLPMLVGQAAAAFRIWFGISPEEGAALKSCREAVAART